MPENLTNAVQRLQAELAQAREELAQAREELAQAREELAGCNNAGYAVVKALTRAEADHRALAELAQARKRIAEVEATNAADLRAMVESHMDMGRGDWVCVPVVDAVRQACGSGWNWTQALQALGSALVTYDAAQQEDTA